MKTHSNNVIVGSTIRVWMCCMVAFFSAGSALHARTVYTSTGGTSGTPLVWRNSGTWSVSGIGAPLVYIIRSGDYIYFDTSNASPYIDTVLVNGFLIMGNNLNMTFTSTGAIGLIGTTSTISGGSNNTVFRWDGTAAFITGPFTAANIISNGPRYASAASTLAAGGVAQPSFVAGTLPLKLGAFYGYCNNGEITLQWTTIMEINSERFEILASRDGAHWTAIAFIPAAGESYSTQYYSYTYSPAGPKPDAYFDTSGQYYFRLRSVDKNMDFSYSPQIGTKCEPLAMNDNSQISVSPNPSVGVPIMNVSSEQPGDILVEIYNENGKLCKTYNFTGLVSEQMFSVSLSDLDPGIYRTRMVTPAATKSATFVKL